MARPAAMGVETGEALDPEVFLPEETVRDQGELLLDLRNRLRLSCIYDRKTS